MNELNDVLALIREMLRSVKYMVDNALSKTTQCYDGVIISQAGNGKWNIRVNGNVYAIKNYSNITPTIGSVVKVIIPQGNQALAWFFPPPN